MRRRISFRARVRELSRRARGAAVAVVVIAVVGCRDSSTIPAAEAGSFAQIQREVFDKSCAVSGCHVSESASGSGSLVLSSGESHAALVGVMASQPNARQDGLRRVVPFYADSSLLYLKLIAGGEHGEYGHTMPVGAEPVSTGTLEFVRRWIAAGAPRSGFVADSHLFANTAAQPIPEFVPLTAPLPGTGFQLTVEPFSVAPNFERELFVYRLLGNADAIYVNRITTAMRRFSHHFLLYSYERGSFPCFAPPTANTVRDIRNANGTLNLLAMLPMACHVFIGGSMNEHSDFVFPAGVALELPAQMGVDVNLHYVNRTSAPVTGEAYANLYVVPRTQVEHVAHPLNMSNTSFELPPNLRTTKEKVFTVSARTTIVALTSHMHALGERFRIQIVGGARNGETIYDNTNWEHPTMLTLSPPLVLQPGEGLRSVVTWNNTTSSTVRFGLLSTDEMAIIFGYAY